MRRTTACACLLLSAIHFAGITTVRMPTASAQKPSAPAALPPVTGGDAIFLKGGAVLRGTLIDVIPGSHARIQLPNGEVQTVQWATIDRIEHVTAPPAPSSTQSAAVPPAESPGVGRVPAVTVHIDTNEEGVRLQGRQDEDYDWQKMCEAPCDAKVPLEWEYRIVGEGLRASSPFEIHARAGERVMLTIDPASNGAFVGGIVIAVVGGVVAVIGLFVFLIGLIAEAISGGSDAKNVVTTGGVMVLGGIGALVGGGIMTGKNSHSSVDITRPAHAGIGDPNATRAAIWNELAPRTTPAWPGARAAGAVPVLTISF